MPLHFYKAGELRKREDGKFSLALENFNILQNIMKEIGTLLGHSRVIKMRDVPIGRQNTGPEVEQKTEHIQLPMGLKG